MMMMHSAKWSDFFSSKDVLKYFSGLIVTHEWSFEEESGSSVDLAHFPVKEYLTSDRIFLPSHSKSWMLTCVLCTCANNIICK